MKKRISLLLVFVLAFTFVLASCGDSECTEHTDADNNLICDDCEATIESTEPTYLGFGYYNTDYKPETADPVAAAEKIDALKNLNYSETKGNLAIFRNNYVEVGENKLAILNTDTGAVVYTAVMEADDSTTTVVNVEIKDFESYVLIVEETIKTDAENGTEYITKLFTALGKEIASKTGDYFASVYEENNDLFVFNDKVYSVKNDVASYKFDKGLVSIPSCDVVTDKYNYDLRDDAIYVYDQSYKTVVVFECPSYYDVMGGGVLADGNIAIQYSEQLPSDAVEYDIERVVNTGYAGPAVLKYNVITVIYNVEDKTETNVELGYIIDFIENEYNNEEFNEIFVEGKLTNVARVCKIVDKKINENDIRYANLGNDLKVMNYLAQEIPNQQGFAKLIDDNRFVVNDKAGKSFLLDEKGAILGEVTDSFDYYECMFATESKLYDSSLKLVLDYDKMNDYEYIDGGDDYSIMVKESEVPSEIEGAEPEVKYDYYIMNPNNATVLTKLDLTMDEIATVYAYSNYFTYKTVVEESNYIVYCNTAGKEIFRLMLDTTTITSADGNTTTRVTDSINSTRMIGDSLFIRVCNYKQVSSTELGYSSVYTYNWYVAK